MADADIPEATEAASRHLATLIGAVAQRDRAAFKELYDRTGAKLFGVVLRIVKNRELAEDVVQDVFVKVWEKAPSYDIAVGRPMTWLIAIARYRSIDVFRSRRVTDQRNVSDEILETFTDERSNEDDIVGRDLITHCLEQLDPLHRDCVVRAYCDGDSREDLGARYGRPVNTIKTWLHRGLASLRSCMEAS